MSDLGHEWTERRIRELEARIRDAYEDAIIDVEDKMAEFVAKHEAKNRDLLDKLKAGKITKDDYKMWLAGQVFQRKRWQATLDDLTETLARANQIAMQIINEEVPEVFAYNANWASYTAEKQLDAAGYRFTTVKRPGGREVSAEESATSNTLATIRFGWGLYDADTVKILLRDEPDLLPPSRVDIPKDKRWNMGNITRQVMQGIVQGESLEQVAKRLRTVAEMNIDSARTHARTAMTGAQNAGRMESYERLERRGIRVEREWIAALDSHTREAHALLDGQHVPVDKPFEVTYKGRTYKIWYPGDPSAHPSMVYNCRCALGAYLPDFPPENGKRRDDDPSGKPIRDMTYQEWLEYKRGEAEGE